MSVTVVYAHVARAVVSAYVTTTSGKVHHVGHLAGHRWSCNCSRGKRCPQIENVRELVPALALDEAANKIEGKPGVLNGGSNDG
jgi:hypothetical protein